MVVGCTYKGKPNRRDWLCDRGEMRGWEKKKEKKKRDESRILVGQGNRKSHDWAITGRKLMLFSKQTGNCYLWLQGCLCVLFKHWAFCPMKKLTRKEGDINPHNNQLFGCRKMLVFSGRSFGGARDCRPPIHSLLPHRRYILNNIWILWKFRWNGLTKLNRCKQWPVILKFCDDLPHQPSFNRQCISLF